MRKGKQDMYLSELFLQTLYGENTSMVAQEALEACNKELCRRMDGVVDEIDCLRYFFNTGQKDEIISPNEKYQELVDFWDVYWEFDHEVPDVVREKMWLLQMIYEADASRITWEKEERKKRLTPEQLDIFEMLCRKFEEKFGKKELAIFIRDRTEFRVWKKFELQGFDGEGIIPERDFAENELLKMFESEGIAVLIVGRIGLTPRRFHGYYISSSEYREMDQREIEDLKVKLAEDNPMAECRGKIRGCPTAYVERTTG